MIFIGGMLFLLYVYRVDSFEVVSTRMSNSPYDHMGNYVANIQKIVNDLSNSYNKAFLPNGSITATGDILMNEHSINNASTISVNTLRYITLDPPVSAGGNVTGPLSSINDALLRYDGTSGELVKNSSITLSDDEVLNGTGGYIDFGVIGEINISAPNVKINDLDALSSNSTDVVELDIPIWDSASGRVLRTSGVSINEISAKLPLTGGIITGDIDLSGNTLLNVGFISGSEKVSAVDDILTCTADSSLDSEIVVFDSDTGKIAKGSGVLVNTIATKLPLTGGIMAGNINMDGNELTNVSYIGGSIKLSAVDDIITSVAEDVTDMNIPVFSGASGRILKDSNISIDSLLIGSESSLDNAIVRYDGITGRLVKNTSITIDDNAIISALGGSIDFGSSGVLNLVSNSVRINGGVVAKLSDLATYVQGPVSAVNDNILIFDSTTGRLIKDSGIAIGSIAEKMPIAGGSFLGHVSLDGNDLTGVRYINGSIKSNAVNDLVTSAATDVSDDDIPIFNGTTGRVLRNSGMQLGQLAIGASSSTDNAIARFDSTTGKAIQNSSILLSDDAKFLSIAGTIDMGTANVINFIAPSVQVNGSQIAKTSDLSTYVQGPVSAIGDNIATFNSTTGKLLKDSGIAIGSIALKLALAGGTMTGSINMGGFNITNAANIAGTVKTSALNDIITSSTNTVSDSHIPIWDSSTGRVLKNSGVSVNEIGNKLPLAGGTMLGSIDMSEYNITNCSLITFPSNNISLGAQATGGSAIAIGINGTSASATKSIAIGFNNISSAQYAIALGNECTSSGLHAVAIGGGSLGIVNMQDNGIAIGSDITLGDGLNGIVIGAGSSIGTVNNAIAIGYGATNSIANSCVIGDTAISSIRPNSTGTCNLGTTNARFKDLIMSGEISGPNFSRSADNVVSNVGSSVSGNLASLSGTTGKVIADSGVIAANVVTNTDAGTSGNLSSFSANKVIADSGVIAANVVTNTGSGTSGNLPTFSANKVIADSGTSLSSLATNASVSTNYLAKAGGTITGTLISSDTTDSSSVSTGAINTAGGLGVGKKAYFGDNLTIGPAQTQTIASKFVIRGTNNSATAGPHINAYCDSSIYPVSQILNLQPGTSAYSFDAFLDSSAVWRSSFDSCFQISKASQRLNFNCSTGTTNSTITWTTAGYIDTVGILQWSKAIKTSDTTASTSTTTGAIISAGGLGVAGSAYIGDSIFIGPTQTRAYDSKFVLQGAGSVATGPHINIYTAVDQYPLYQQLNWAHNNITQSFDAYHSSASVWTSSSSASNFQIGKLANQFRFNYASGIAAGSTVTWTTAGYIDTSGILQWNKPIKTADTTASSSTTTGAITCAGGLGVTGSAYIGSQAIIGPTQTITQAQALTLRGTDANTSGPHIIAYTSVDQHPVFQVLNYGHDNVAVNFDYYWDGAWKSANAGSNFNIYKRTNQLQFNYNSGTAQGAAAGFNLAGCIDTAGILQWSRPIKTSDTTASSSTTTGALTIAGGAGITGNINSAGIIKTTNTTASTSTATGAIVSAGGLGVAGAAYIGTNCITTGYSSSKTNINSTTKFSQCSNCTAISNTVTESSLFAGITKLGISSYGGNSTTNGLYIRLTMYATLTMTAGGSISLRFRQAAYSIVLANLTFTPVSTSTCLIKIIATSCLQTGAPDFCTVLTAIECHIPGQSIQTTSSSTNSWHPNNNNILDLTAQFSVASVNNSIQSNMSYIESLYDA